MKDRTVAIGAFAFASFSVLSGLMVGVAGGAFGTYTAKVQPPPLAGSGLQLAGVHDTPVAYQVVIPPTPTWQMAELTTPRPQPTTTSTVAQIAGSPSTPAPTTDVPTVELPTSEPSTATSPTTEPIYTEALTTEPSTTTVTTRPAPQIAREAAGETPTEPAAPPLTTTTAPSAPTITIPPITTRPHR